MIFKPAAQWFKNSNAEYITCLETSDILEILEPSSDEEVCNYDSGSDVDIFESGESVSSMTNSKNDKN